MFARRIPGNIDKFGDTRALRSDDNGLLVSMDYQTAIARGLIEGASLFRQIGRNLDIDDVREDAWEEGGTYVFPSNSGIQMRVVSTDNTNDKAGGTGALTVDVHYLDANGAEREETVTVNGTTPVNTVATNIRRVQDFHVKSAGSTGLAAGKISLTNTAGTVTYSSIGANNGRSRQAIWTIPAGKVGFINEILVSGNATGGGVADYVEGYLRATCDFDGTLLPGIFNFKGGLIQSNSGVWQPMLSPIIVPALGDIKMSISSRSASSNVLAVAGFAGWMENI